MIVFSHIPKTAGTTFNEILRKNLGPRLISVIPEKGTTYLKTDFEKDFGQKGLPAGISGHALKPYVDFGQRETDFEWITFLRDPIKRYVSQYVHQQTSQFKEFTMDIRSWGEKYQRSNWQVNWIAGEEDLNAAKQILACKFKFIGVVERFDESLQLMNKVFSSAWDISYKKPKMVARDKRMKLELLSNQEFVKFIHAQNALDLELYDYVLNSCFNRHNAAATKGVAAVPMSKLRERASLLGYYFKNYMYRKTKIQ